MNEHQSFKLTLPPLGASRNGGCLLCGRTPARPFRLRLNIGMLLMRQWLSFDGYLCREHGLQATRYYLWRTALLGWWGVNSFFANLLALPLDLFGLFKAWRLSPPVGNVDSALGDITFKQWVR